MLTGITMKNFSFLLCAFVLACPVVVSAQEPFSIGGYIETYYSYDFSEPASGDRPLVFNHARHNEFAINLALLDLRYATDDMRARVALQTGTYAASNYAAEPVLLQTVHEASAGFRITEDFWLDAGVLASHIGLESAVGRDNWTLTRSLAAEYSPYYETGLRLELLPSTGWTVRLLALNGWQNIRETNSDKAIGTQVHFAPSEGIQFNWSTFVGNEAPDSAQSRMRVFNDLYAQLALTDDLAVAAVLDIGMQSAPETEETDMWYATTLLLRYNISPAVSLSVRGEYIRDERAVVFPAEDVLGFSLNTDWRPTDRVTVRLEGRIFRSDTAVFSYPSGMKRTNGVITTSIGFTL